MARNPPLLTSSTPTALAPAKVTIGHIQLRDLIVCPREHGVVNYLQNRSIIEHDLHAPHSTPRALAELTFRPNAIAALQIPDSNTTLFAAGGLDADLHLSLHTPRSSSSHEEEEQEEQEEGASSRTLWQLESRLLGSINNSVLLTSMSLTRSFESAVEPKVAISNNDCTVKFYDIPLRGELPPKAVRESGMLRLDVAVNHSSLSPDGRTLLSVGDSPKVYLHQLTGGGWITFSPITTLTLPPPSSSPLNYASSSPAASFSTAFSTNGSKFAVASQEGSVVVWDVRSSKPLKVFHTDKTRTCTGKVGNGSGNGGASGWLSDDPWDWSRGGSRAPGWGVRSVKFGRGGECGHSGKEIMTFTEHTSLVHMVDADTFNTEEIVRMPAVSGHGRRQPAPPRRSHSPRHITVTGAVFSRPIPNEQPPPPPIVLALQDTFRISSSDASSSSSQTSSATTRWRARRMRARGGGGGGGDGEAETEEDDLVVIPPLGDRAVENDVQRLLERHGIRARHRDAYTYSDDVTSMNGYVGEQGGRVVGGDDMEVDELESDCASSHAPSRAASPAPPAQQVPPVPSVPVSVPASPVPVFNAVSSEQPQRMRRRTWTQDDFRRAGQGASGRHLNPLEEVDGDGDAGADMDMDMDMDLDLDLAGTCFDPAGGYVYVASVNGVAEWSIRGAEKRWWVDSKWA